VGVIVAAVAVAVAGFAIASSGTKSKHDASKPARIVIRGGKPVGGIKKITVNKGDRVRFSVTSDVADEVHVHGYNFHKDVAKGGTVSFDFPAKIDGDFEAELESRKEQILALTVEP
jgi:plastocyanin